METMYKIYVYIDEMFLNRVTVQSDEILLGFSRENMFSKSVITELRSTS